MHVKGQDEGGAVVSPVGMGDGGAGHGQERFRDDGTQDVLVLQILRQYVHRLLDHVDLGVRLDRGRSDDEMTNRLGQVLAGVRRGGAAGVGHRLDLEDEGVEKERQRSDVPIVVDAGVGCGVLVVVVRCGEN